MAIHPLQHPQPATQHTLLVAGADHEQRTFLAGQLDGDGHTVYDADHTAAVIAKLSAHTVDVLVLGEFERPSEAATLVRSVRADKHPRIHPALAVITLGASDELSALRAYESGSDHTTWPPARATSCCAPSSPRSSGGSWRRAACATCRRARSRST